MPLYTNLIVWGDNDDNHSPNTNKTWDVISVLLGESLSPASFLIDGIVGSENAYDVNFIILFQTASQNNKAFKLRYLQSEQNKVHSAKIGGMQEWSFDNGHKLVEKMDDLTLFIDLDDIEETGVGVFVVECRDWGRRFPTKHLQVILLPTELHESMEGRDFVGGFITEHNNFKKRAFEMQAEKLVYKETNEDITKFFMRYTDGSNEQIPILVPTTPLLNWNILHATARKFSKNMFILKIGQSNINSWYKQTIGADALVQYRNHEAGIPQDTVQVITRMYALMGIEITEQRRWEWFLMTPNELTAEEPKVDKYTLRLVIV